jgi:hypothetical protein
MSKTIDQILLEVRQHKPCSEIHLRRQIKALDIQPIGARQRPQRYPADAAATILRHWGIEPNATNGTREPKPARIVTMPELRAARERARRGK